MGILVAFLASAAPAPAANQNVTATPVNTFSPKHVAVNVSPGGAGDSVTWTNSGGTHNVRFENNSFTQPSPPSSSSWMVSRFFTTVGTFRYYCEVHGAPGGIGMSGTVAVNVGYPRPAGATPLRTPLVPAYKPCEAASANRTHGPPLAHPSCNAPVQASNWLTVGSPDANGKTTNSVGSVVLHALVGNPGTIPDEADVGAVVSVTDVRTKSNLTDYTGELQAKLGLRITDRKSGPSIAEPATGDTTLNIVVPCSATADAAVGSTCSVTTTADSIIPGAVPEGRRSIWEIGKVELYDGGADGDTSTPAGDTLFAKQGIFIP